MQHLVQKVQFDLTAAEGSQQILEQAQRFINSALTGPIVQVFDEYCADGSTIEVDLVELDLGFLDLQYPRADWRGLLRASLHTQKPLNSSEQTRRQLSTVEAAADLASTDQILASLLFYLREGVLPWNQTRSLDELQTRLAQSFGNSTELLSQLRLTLVEKVNTHASRVRLIALDPPVVNVCLHALTQIEWDVKPNLPPRRARDELLATLIQLQEPAKQAASLSDDEQKNVMSPIVVRENEYENTNSIVTKNVIDAAPNTAGAGADQLMRESAYMSEPVNWYVQYAGIALVIPYLPTLFRELGLLQQNGLTDPELATLVTYYLATGEDAHSEVELVLAKLICGLEVQHPIENLTDLAEQITRETDALLNAVIENWPQLGNTSLAVLRETFFLRDGKWVHGEHGAELLVEQRGVDLLLSTLPWTISKVQLPWLDAPLNVYWA